jgi:Holliday junction DNA helicase RuvB
VAEPIRTPGVIAADLVHTAHPIAEDDAERGLRPRRLEEFVGQEALKAQLRVSIEAARSRGEALDHVLLAGPPGLGKTSLARIVAEELGVRFESTAGPALERKADIAAMLTALEPNAVFFVDEIHRLPRALEETFYPAMEDHQLPITVGAGAGARIVTLDLPPFTLIGATTRPACSRPRCATASASSTGSSTTARRTSRRSCRGRRRARRRDRPRRRPRDRRPRPRHARGSPTGCSSACATTRRSAAAAASTPGSPTPPSICSRSTTRGSTVWTARSSPRCATRSAAGPVACRPSPSAWGEEADTIEDVYEPYLLQRGFLQRTPRGRCATRRAFEHLGCARRRRRCPCSTKSAFTRPL